MTHRHQVLCWWLKGQSSEVIKTNVLSLLPNSKQRLFLNVPQEQNPMPVIWYDDLNLHKIRKCPAVTVMCCKLKAIVEAQREFYLKRTHPHSYYRLPNPLTVSAFCYHSLSTLHCCTFQSGLCFRTGESKRGLMTEGLEGREVSREVKGIM